MGRIESLSVLSTEGGRALLAEKYGPIVQNIQSRCLSFLFKNEDIVGTIDSGSVIARRFSNTETEDYGTESSDASKLHLADVIIPIDQHKQWIKDIESFDIQALGVDGVLNRIAERNEESAVKYLDRTFWAEAYNGWRFVSNKASIADKIDEAIVSLESTHTEFDDGIDRERINIVLSPQWYTAVQKLIDTLPGEGGKSYGLYHLCPVYATTDLPSGVNCILIVKGSIGHPGQFNVVAGQMPRTLKYYSGLVYDGACKVCADEELRCIVPALEHVGCTNANARITENNTGKKITVNGYDVTSAYDRAKFPVTGAKLVQVDLKNVLPSTGTVTVKQYNNPALALFPDDEFIHQDAQGVWYKEKSYAEMGDDTDYSIVLQAGAGTVEITVGTEKYTVEYDFNIA